jgi:1-acyl-sn-glycerol-3-phosphate acyltransferase
VIFRLYLHFKWVAKKSLFFFPFIGWNMFLCRYILIERGRGGSIRRMMDKAVANIKKRNSVMIFPEGTRSKDGRLQTFKPGAFQIALETKVPILPIVISGTHQAIQKGGFLIHLNRKIKATILDPIPYKEFMGMEAKELTVKVHDIMEDRLGKVTSDE